MAFSFGGATVANLYLQRKRQKKLEKAQKQAADVEKAQRGEEAARARRATIREAMVKRAQIENVAGASGQSTSSAAVSAAQQLTGEAASNIGQINTSLALGNLATNAQTAINKAQVPSTLEQVTGVAQQAALAFA